MPQVDIRETGGNQEVVAELPGVECEDIGVTLSHGVLTIRGEKKTEASSRGNEKQNDTWHAIERSYESFMRSFSVGENIDADKIMADFTNGVLKITIPHLGQPKNKAKKIDISEKK
ncbi:MAG: Hsp20/alpha crystallin family protein [Alphaproteobacteria bacterium]